MSNDARQIRHRQAAAADDLDRAPFDDSPSVFSGVVQLVKVEGRWPDGGPGSQVYMARVVRLLGQDVPGADVDVEMVGDPFRVYNSGNGTPPDPDLGVPTRTIITAATFEYYDH